MIIEISQCVIEQLYLGACLGFAIGTIFGLWAGGVNWHAKPGEEE